MIALLVIGITIGFLIGYLMSNKEALLQNTGNISQAWYWVLPVSGFLIAFVISVGTIISSDNWDEIFIFFVLYGGFWIPLLLIIPFVGNKLKPSPIWMWVASIIGFPSGFVLGCFVATVLGVIFLGGV